MLAFLNKIEFDDPKNLRDKHQNQILNINITSSSSPCEGKNSANIFKNDKKVCFRKILNLTLEFLPYLLFVSFSHKTKWYHIWYHLVLHGS